MSPITFVAVQVRNYEGRGAEYASKLFNGVRKHMPKRFDLRCVCLTDDAKTVPEGVEPIMALPGIRGWWNKCQLFRPGMFAAGERVMFCDLDTIIVGDIGDFADYDGDFAAMRDPFFPDRLGSAIMVWEAGKLDHVWTLWDQGGRPQFNPQGDQRWIESAQPRVDWLQDMLPEQIRSFKADCRPLGRVPDNTRILVFHGQPRPHAVPEKWAAELWAAA